MSDTTTHRIGRGRRTDLPASPTTDMRLRGVPRALHARLWEIAAERGASLNATVVALLRSHPDVKMGRK